VEEEVTMALRVFTDREGRERRVWEVQLSADEVGVREDLRGGWLCFELVRGGERCRLPLADVMPGWEQLSDAQLDELRRTATAVPPLRGHAPTERRAGHERE
jgi:hypothetical protein